MSVESSSDRKIKKILVANRSEIAIRIIRAAAELGIKTVGIYAEQDRRAAHRFNADESYVVGKGKLPLEAYLDIEDIIRIAKETNTDAIHPGYGFLAENPDFAKACRENGIIFIGPSYDVLNTLGNKVAARNAAIAAGVPVMPASEALPRDEESIKRIAKEIGYPVMLKASWGGGGRGMRAIYDESTLMDSVREARGESLAAFGNDEVYFEKLIERARHVEVQLLGDQHGNIVHLWERDCSVQRRHQKVVERAPAPYLSQEKREEICESALKLGKAVNYSNAGTVEFLMDADTEQFYFIEVNPRIQVEHTVTEEVTGVDLVKAQIQVAEGAKIGSSEMVVPPQAEIKLKGSALQCRVTTEDPANNFLPGTGTIIAYRSPAGFGIRLDGGTAYSGAVISPYYDSLLVKVTTWGNNDLEAIERMDRALREFRIRGVSTNLSFVENVINHPKFIAGDYTTKFIDQNPELFDLKERQDRSNSILKFLGDVAVNGHPELEGRSIPKHFIKPILPQIERGAIERREGAPVKGSRDLLLELGPKGFSEWMREQKEVLITDTTMRDAHQSLFATRMRSHDLWEIAPYYAKLMPELFSLECWGGATFDVSMRFLNEDPWERLVRLREMIPGTLFQMLLRGVNGVGYTSYPDNVIQYFVKQAAEKGIDLFRIFDSLNIVDNMRISIDSVLESGKLVEGTICYTADLFDAKRPKYHLNYYVKLAKELEKAGAHIIGIKDMAGVCRPEAARALVKALKEEIELPIHFHTHDTSGMSAASVLAAVEAGVDAIDAAMDSLSGLTSQPPMGSIIHALKGSERASRIDVDAMHQISTYWEGVRSIYAPFESTLRSGTSDVYNHEMPGGQYTNLREQARSMGLEPRWNEVSKAYAEVNQLLGDIVKVTPSSKVVGDMALMMVTQDITAEDVLDPNREIAFPQSVVGLLKGELGIPEGGFPENITAKVLKEEKPIEGRPGAHLPPVDLVAEKENLEAALGYEVSETDLASYLMYPAVFKAFKTHQEKYGNVSNIPSKIFFYGPEKDTYHTVELEQGKDLLIKLLAISLPDATGHCNVFFELNGEIRAFSIPKNELASDLPLREKREKGNPYHVAAMMPGVVGTVHVKVGDIVKEGDAIVTLEAMKMETTIRAEASGAIERVLVEKGDVVEAEDLLVEIDQ
ncbi:pyruvate carboxylase [Ignatzschineria cameli]|uniref:pyruvate carboxylase n=1 Tax=Ignatzschineria cameli TaxID=2182793 RepID=UPI000D61BBB0|nr:pyruvate carboxylase [Ignatzschineria cameli]PWD86112.1 pyruvate carboxylase [Ignatzschineria cameli]